MHDAYFMHVFPNLFPPVGFKATIFNELALCEMFKSDAYPLLKRVNGLIVLRRWPQYGELDFLFLLHTSLRSLSAYSQQTFPCYVPLFLFKNNSILLNDPIKLIHNYF